MMLNIDILKLIKQLLPSFLRQPIRIAWLQALFAPIMRMWNGYTGWRTDKVYEAHVTAQTISLQAYLNKLFDPVLNRIVIKHGEQDELYIALRVEGYDEMYIDGDDGEYVHLSIEIDTEVISGFIVDTPSTIDQTQLKGVIESIKLAGVEYTVIIR